ncbi:MAG: transporter ATP-binding protein [Acidimicrobiales bacterium]|nr:transporter ATP-binding protein [Acidimicrobiales bacterium]
MSDPALACARGVARAFGEGPGAVVAVHDVDCSIRRGDRIALMGPSGSGKTTLLHLLAGLDRPTTGTVEWPGIGTLAELRPGPVAVVFQAPSLLPPLDVAENVALPLLLAGVDRHEARRRAIDALTLLGLQDLTSKLPEELSGGQAQRVAIARVVAGQAQLILADEPTGQLDHRNGAAVIDTLVDAAAHTGGALVVNTHDPAVAERLDVRWSMTNGTLHLAEHAPC